MQENQASSAVIVRYTELYDAQGGLSGERIASLILNRASAANALSGDMLEALTQHCHAVKRDASVRVLLLQGAGKHFSAGADLAWMQASARLGHAENLVEAEKLRAMFEALAQLAIPTVAVVKGAVYGGAVGLVAACDYALAAEDSRFCLSEARIGLIPAVILPYLARKLSPGLLHKRTLGAQVFSAREAEAMGLVQQVLPVNTLEVELQRELSTLLQASPEAQAQYKALYIELSQQHWQQSPMTEEAIARIRASAMGQEGLAAFFEKRQPSWTRYLPEHVSLIHS